MKLGEKIKKYRKRVGLSQVELEQSINAASGVISRIESNKVNPTKETLKDISKILNLENYELLDLLGLSDYKSEIESKVYKSIYNLVNKKIIENLDKKEIVGSILEEIDKLGFIFPSVFEKDGKYLRIIATSVNKKMIQLGSSLLRKSIYDFKFSTDTESTIAKVVKYNHLEVTNSMYEFVAPSIPRSGGILVKKHLGIKSIVVVPLSINNNVIGCISVGSKQATPDEVELDLIKFFAEKITILLKS